MDKIEEIVSLIYMKGNRAESMKLSEAEELLAELKKAKHTTLNAGARSSESLLALRLGEEVAFQLGTTRQSTFVTDIVSKVIDACAVKRKILIEEAERMEHNLSVLILDCTGFDLKTELKKGMRNYAEFCQNTGRSYSEFTALKRVVEDINCCRNVSLDLSRTRHYAVVVLEVENETDVEKNIKEGEEVVPTALPKMD